MSDPMSFRVRMPAPLDEVHHALTDAKSLRTWLAEHAEVELPHRYEFWGRYTPDGAEPHQRLLHVDDHTVRFSWLVDGTDTTVEITLEEDGPRSTFLTLSQTNLPAYSETMTETGPLTWVHTFWALAVANLVEHLEGRELTPKCDFSTVTMRAQLTVDASPQAVYDSLVDPAKFAKWFGANMEIEPHVGGRWAMGSFEENSSPAKIVEFDPGHRLSFAWDQGLVATWELAESDGKTRLTFVQSGFDEQNPPYDSWMGWLSGFAELRRFHEQADWRPVWLELNFDGLPEGLLNLD